MCHNFLLGATANPPKSDDRYAQLTRGAFMINDFLQNPPFSSHFVDNRVIGQLSRNLFLQYQDAFHMKSIMTLFLLRFHYLLQFLVNCNDTFT